MISERTLRKWRKEALTNMRGSKDLSPYLSAIDKSYIHEIKELSRSILSLTQELLDQHLTKKP